MPLHLDQATSLEHIGDTVYIGFNADLTRISFPRLKAITGALIIESNGMLESIQLPVLETVGKYLHIHECFELVEIIAPRLRTIGGELSLLSCPRLATIRIATASRPVSATRLDVAQCGAPMLPGLHLKTTS
jgi:hypothetical protein